VSAVVAAAKKNRDMHVKPKIFAFQCFHFCVNPMEIPLSCFAEILKISSTAVYDISIVCFSFVCNLTSKYFVQKHCHQIRGGIIIFIPLLISKIKQTMFIWHKHQ